MKGQRYVIWFLWKQRKTGAEILRELESVYGIYAPSRTMVYKWTDRFENGWEDVEDEERSGRPCSSRTEEIVQRVHQQVEKDRRQSVEEIAEGVGISSSSAHRILVEDLAMSRVVARWVPKLLTPVMKTARVSACRELLSLYEANPENFLTQLVTGDETWFHFYEPTTKQQSSQWVTREDARPVKAKTVASMGKRMATIFWDSHGVLLLEWLPDKHTINSDYYVDILGKLKEAIKRKRRGKWTRGILLQQDNASSHTSRKTSAAITDLGYKLLPHPPYSPDLAPSDYWLFSALKNPLRGRHYENLAGLASAVTKVVEDTDEEWFAEGLKKLPERWQKCINLKGDYIEKLSSE